MQIRIEIDLTPEELRRFVGLPDVAGLQDDVVTFLRDKVGQAGDFDAAAFLKSNLELLRRNPAMQKLLEVARVRGATVEDIDEAVKKSSPRRSRPRRRNSSD